MRPIILAGNWKMYKTQAEALNFFQQFFPLVHADARSRSRIVFGCPFTALAALQAPMTKQGLSLAAQNIHWADQGAFTGEISGSMLTELGVQYVIIGHSERRQYFGETDQTVNLRLQAAQRHGLTPILCVGETKSERDHGITEARITDQLSQDLVGIDQGRLVIAYEPIWAIGTGETCAASEANRVVGLIRSQLNHQDVPIQYGGSVKPDNIDEIMAQSEIDGVLVGGASLEAASFARIVNYQKS